MICFDLKCTVDILSWSTNNEK